jgi:hypothetical protein
MEKITLGICRFCAPILHCLLAPSLEKMGGGGPGRVAQVLEHLPSKCEALNSNPSTEKIKIKKATSQSITNFSRKWIDAEGDGKSLSQ